MQIIQKLMFAIKIDYSGGILIKHISPLYFDDIRGFTSNKAGVSS